MKFSSYPFATEGRQNSVILTQDPETKIGDRYNFVE
jgi:hypothetical protein